MYESNRVGGNSGKPIDKINSSKHLCEIWLKCSVWLIAISIIAFLSYLVCVCVCVRFYVNMPYTWFILNCIFHSDERKKNQPRLRKSWPRLQLCEIWIDLKSTSALSANSIEITAAYHKFSTNAGSSESMYFTIKSNYVDNLLWKLKVRNGKYHIWLEIYGNYGCERCMRCFPLLNVDIWFYVMLSFDREIHSIWHRVHFGTIDCHLISTIDDIV